MVMKCFSLFPTHNRSIFLRISCMSAIILLTGGCLHAQDNGARCVSPAKTQKTGSHTISQRLNANGQAVSSPPSGTIYSPYGPVGVASASIGSLSQGPQPGKLKDKYIKSLQLSDLQQQVLHAYDPDFVLWKISDFQPKAH